MKNFSVSTRYRDGECFIVIYDGDNLQEKPLAVIPTGLAIAAPALLGALHSLGTHPEYGYCFCLNRSQINNGHTGECKEARIAIAKAEDK